MLPLFFAVSFAYTVTVLFTNARFAEMTLSVAQDTFRLARRSPYTLTDRFRLTIYAASDIDCSFFEPFDCVDTQISFTDYQALLLLRLYTLRTNLAYPHVNVTGYFMLDSDVVLLRNVADRLDRSTADVVFQREVPCALQQCVNGGVWWVRVGSQPVLEFLNRIISLMVTLRLPDQEAFDLAVATKSHTLRLEFLPPFRYPNGFVLEANDRLLSSSMHLAHANWCDYRHKRERLQQIAASRSGYLPTPLGTNQTRICKQIRSLDLHNLAPVFGCRSAQSCEKRISDRCLDVS